MEKRNIVGIVAVVAVIGATLLLVGCVGKARVDVAPSDMVITNTHQVRDIRDSKLIHDEARQRLITVIRKNNFVPDGDVKFERVVAYNSLGNRHYIAMEFTMHVVGHPETGYAVAYLSIDETAGQYKVVDDLFNFSSFPDTDKYYKQTYEEILNNVKFCEGMLPNDAKKM